jgi:hypothetical protein
LLLGILFIVQKTKDGLEAINLSVYNDYLLMKHLHKFNNKVDLTWVKLVWGSYYLQDLPPVKTKDVS